MVQEDNRNADIVEIAARIEVLEHQYMDLVDVSTTMLAEVRALRADLSEKYRMYTQELMRVHAVAVKILKLSGANPRRSCRVRQSRTVPSK